MPFAKCKVYSDGSHYIAIPPKPQKPRPKKGAKVKKETPDLEEMDDDEAEDCPFDKPAQPVQMSLFEGEKQIDKQDETESVGQEIEQTCNENEDNAESKPSRKDIFEALYKKYIFADKRKRKREIIRGLLPYSKDYEDAKLFTELNLRRKRNNLIARRIRMTRKANLQEDFNFFVTLTYSNELHTEESFKKELGNCLKNLSKRKGWKCNRGMGTLSGKTTPAFSRHLLYPRRHNAGEDDRRQRLQLQITSQADNASEHLFQRAVRSFGL